MIADGACGIDVELVRAPGVSDLFSKNDFGCGRTADISEADEENAGAGGWLAHASVIGGIPMHDNAKPGGDREFSIGITLTQGACEPMMKPIHFERTVQLPRP